MLPIVLLCVCVTTAAGLSDHPLLLMVSFDGFRHDYFTKVPTPNFDNFKTSGVYVPEVGNVFVTQTFPNHFSMVTGRYVEDHGVVGTSAYDSLLERNLTFKSPEMFNYDESVMPLWALNEKAANDRHSGSVMWIGGEHGINGVNNTYSVKLNKSVSFQGRLNLALEWFMMSDKPANLVFLYYNEPDSTGHTYGPESDEMKAAVTSVDENVGYLMEAVKKHNLSDKLNIILTSDHGMVTLNPNYILVDDLFERGKVELYGSSPLLQVRVLRESDTQDVYDRLKEKSKDGHFKVYYKEDLPEEWHFKNNHRVQKILLLADFGYDFNMDENWKPKGNHGYDNAEPLMHGFFMGSGPGFKKNVVLEGNFSTLDVYPLACKILNLNPYPNNGTLRNGLPLLKMDDSSFSLDVWIIVVIVLSVLLTVLISTYLYKRAKKQKFQTLNINA